MAHDVFISHSSKDKPVADAVCFALEAGGVRCWIAPRDVPPGRGYSGEITRAIRGCRVMVLVFSSHSNESRSVLNEVEIAHEARAHIINFRVEDAGANDDLQFYLRRLHWLDAITPPMERYHAQLLAAVRGLLNLVPGGMQPAAGIASPAPSVPDTAPTRQGLAQAWLDRALQLLVRVEDAKSRSRLQQKIAAAQVRSGDLPAALRTVQSMEQDQQSAFGAVAAAQAQAGDIPGALATAAQLTEPEPCRIAQRSIAGAQARAGDVVAAMRTALAINHTGDQDSALGDIAIAQARAGDLPAALETLQRIPAVPRGYALSMFAAELAEAGDLPAALEIFERIEGSKRDIAIIHIATAKVQAGDIDGARRLAASVEMEFLRKEAFAGVAIAQARSGDIPAALRAAASDECAGFGQLILESVALTQARGGDIATALRTVAKIDADRTVVAERAIGRIAALQVLQGDPAGAEQTLSTLDPGYPRAHGYQEAATQLLDETSAKAC